MKQTLRIAINGFGRIGRAFVRQIVENPHIELVAINDLGSLESLSYLLKYDTVYGKANFEIASDEEQKTMTINDKKVTMLQEKDPNLLPWKDLDIDCVVECTGLFTEYAKANAHILAGAKHVVISAPGKSDETGAVSGVMALMGINSDQITSCNISSNASCTTNASSPLIVVLDEALGVEKAILSTTHAYTGTQAIVDGPSKKDLREGRAAAQNIVPSSTGAAKAVGSVYPNLAGKFDGISLRVPVASGSIVDVTFIAKRNTSVLEVIEILEKASQTDRWKKTLAVSHEPLVSSDIVGNPIPCIVDSEMVKVVDGNLVKVLAWYDNEWGYTATLVQHVLEVLKK
jgi:glyceraldehyde 3-phosphate dehydrogenase